MVRQKHRWTMEEEEALIAGVEKYGQGKWKTIVDDPQFASCFSDRSNVDLKDKWRNLNASSVRAPKIVCVTSNPPLSSLEPSAAALLLEYGSEAGPSRSSPDTIMSPDYKAVIMEALSSFEDPNGLDINDILNFIESKYEVPENFRESVTSKLRNLVLTGEVQKVNNCYKLRGAFLGAETSQEEDIVPTNIDNCNEEQNAQEASVTPISTETPEEAAARLVAEAENLDKIAIEACKRRDMLEGLLEESLVMRMLAKNFYEQCSRDGIVVLKP
uniref:telomere repeat-binding factor 4-like n=1 Tax=Erigeron canadensis TaxID=72917 RepID=UPI001CB99E2A|nr:telomere repeat-binding factor 4-like [Erigeron canadensis]XP_043616760.1 telomere repeat-binding factor 4-like [Erigeron canadensis]